jgi:hypothetical protein
MNARASFLHLLAALVPFASGSLAGPQVPPAGPTPGISVHAIRAEIVPEAHHLRVHDTIAIDPSTLSSPTVPFRFLLHENLTIDAMTLDGETVVWTAHEGFDPKHFWAKPDYAALAEMDHVREIEVTPPRAWRGTPHLTVRYSGAINDTLHPPREDYGRSFETTTGLIEARGVYLDGGTGWVPTIPDDLCTFEIEATVPGGWDVMSQGDTPVRESSDGHRQVRITCREPMDSIYLIAGPWQRMDAKHGMTDILVYLYKDDPELRTRYVEATARYLDRYESLLGPYPFSKFALVENFWETGYGMPSFTLLGSTVLRLPFIVQTSYGHEILHCWWGNGVYVDTDRGNWCEGLTSYMADHAYKEDESPAAAAEYRRDQLTAYLNFVRDARDIPLTAFRERHSGATQAIGYGKSLFVFHMLRKRLGDERFFGSLRAFYETHRFREASWEDLLASFEREGGIELSRFRDEWIVRTGAPALTLEATALEETRDGYRLAATLAQTEPVYTLDVPVRVLLADGSMTSATWSLASTSAPFEITTKVKPTRLVVDPEFDVFRRLDRLEIPPVLNQTMGADSTVIIVGESASAQLTAGYTTLRESLEREPGVRVISERDADLDALTGSAIWLLGPTRFDDRWKGASPPVMPPGIEAKDGSPPRSWLATKRHPTNPDLSWTRIELASSEHAAAIARKVPHYGRYSYLVFEGATNVGKGVWSLDQSPLIASFPGDDHAP